MRILGNRVLVSPIEKEVQEGFQTVEVQDSFVYKGKVEQIGDERYVYNTMLSSGSTMSQEDSLVIGAIIIFAKYSPDTQEIEHEGKKYKAVRIEDIMLTLLLTDFFQYLQIILS